MKYVKLSVLAFALASPLTSWAFSSASVRVDEPSQEYQNQVEAYAAKNRKAVPEIRDYAYGMKLDIAKLVIKSPALKSCQVNSKWMTYEDSQGELNTVRYKVLSECPGKN
ncbi:DUF2790 domain-containing protein [Pseudomonas sp. NPDC089734]|uniref:DUF2790 domain-containing protein n=1 Tax=Pseudomonas sp. NPDC089734 TaxID=3364469 RepID=UPI00380EA592